MKIIKRNGVEVDFDKHKIVVAISKANKEVVESERLNEDTIISIANFIQDYYENIIQRIPNVEDVQDLVERKLMETNKYEVAQKYIRYRYKRELVRKSNTTDEQILTLIECNNEDIKQENSNKNPTVVSVQRDYMAGEVSKDITKRFLLPKDIWDAHEQGIIHFHDSDYFSQKLINCFTGGTKLVTGEGLRPFKTFHDGEKITVKDKNGVLREATVHQYGKQRMQIVSLKSGVMEHQVICTPNHRWLLSDGSFTEDLKVGDRLYPTQDSTKPLIASVEDAKAFCIGFIIGDGSDCDYDASYVRLCGKKKVYADIFKMAGYSIRYNKSTNDDPVALRYPGVKQRFLNGKGWRFMSPAQKAMAFKGYYAADGAVDSNQVSTADDRVACFIEETSCVAGYYISSKKEIYHDTNFKKNARLINYHFIVKNQPNMLWKVVSIAPYGHGEVPAWCVEEPITHTFTLEKGIVTGNCCLINLEDMLQNGTVITGTMIEKPHSFTTACNIATQIIAQVASSQYGGQTITLSHLAPFVDISRQKIRRSVREELTSNGIDASENVINKITESRVKEEINRGVQMIQYQVITLMTTNGQAPFITVFMYINEVPEGQTRDDLVLIIEEMLKQRTKGVKNEKGVYITPAFPKLIYVLQEDNIEEGTKYWWLTKLAAECTAKRMVPDYISEKKMLELKIDENGNGNCYPCMGCRSFLTPYVDENGKPKYYGRFNQGVVTINLVDVACSSGKDMNKFWEIFDERLDLCYRALMCRHKRLEGTPSDFAPIHWQNGALARLKKGETIDKLLHGGYSTISLGYAGLYECVYYMTGHSHTDENAKPFALAIMQHLNDKCMEWRNKEDIHFSLYGTPIESTTYKFAKCLQKRFGKIPGVTDKNYITNSYHVHVTEPIDAFTKLSFESEFQHLSPGGAISYVETPNMQNNIDAVLAVIKHIYNTIIYGELNTKSDYCQECGYNGEIQIKQNEDGKLIWECPNCGNTDQNKMNVARRTCGYIGTQFWNQGRTQEIKDRVTHL